MSELKRKFEFEEDSDQFESQPTQFEDSDQFESELTHEDRRFLQAVGSDTYNLYITEAHKEELDEGDRNKDLFHDTIQINLASKLCSRICQVYDAETVCKNLTAVDTCDKLSCYKCKKRFICESCWFKCRRCHVCYLAMNKKSNKMPDESWSFANGTNDPLFTDLFALRHESRQLSVEENIFCCHKLQNSRLFLNHSSLTNQTPRSDQLRLMAMMLDEHLDSGFFCIKFHQMADKHYDSRVVRLLPLFLEEQFKIAGIIAAKATRPSFIENRVDSSVPGIPLLVEFKTTLNSCGMLQNPYASVDSLPMCGIIENIKNLVHSSGVIPKTSVFVGSLGDQTHIDFIRMPPGSTVEENHTEFPPPCACSKLEPPRFYGSTMLINYSMKNINIGVGQPTCRTASECGVDIPDRSLMITPHNFQYWFKGNTSSTNVDIFKVYIDRGIGYRKYVKNAQFVPESDDEDEEDE